MGASEAERRDDHAGQALCFDGKNQKYIR